MRGSFPVIMAVAIATLLCPEARGSFLGRRGPADHPERYPDYGGTPDVTLSDELGLTVGEVEEILTRTASPDRAARVAAALELKKSAAGSEKSLGQVLWGNHGARNTQIREVILIARRKLGDGEDDGAGLLGALLEMDPEHAEKGPGTRASVRVMSMLVALWSLDTMAGYKVMLDFSGRHAGVFRQEIGRMLVARGFDALPALIYGRGSDDKELHMFAVKWIRDMGDPLLGDQIRGIKNPRRLAQLLEAYASVNELDAIDVTMSMAAHESVFVRESARACLGSYGKNAKWSSRRQYENTFGGEPPEGTDVEDWLRKLYEHWDGQRIADALADFERGLAHMKLGEYRQMEELFLRVLREEPMFERRHEMAAGFMAMASRQEESEHIDEARATTLLAARLAGENSQEARAATAKLEWLEAEANRLAGALDQEYYRKAAREDPDREGASIWANLYTEGDWSPGRIVPMAVMVSLLVFFSALLVYRRLSHWPGEGKSGE